MAKSPAAILYDESGNRTGVEDNALRVGADPVKVAIHADSTVTTSGSQVLTGYGQTELVLFINVKDSPTGTNPTLQYTIEEVDPGDEETVIGSALQGAVLTDAGTQQLPFRTMHGGAVKVSWALTGTTPSFTAVYTTLLAKQGASVMMGVGVGASYPDPVGTYTDPAAGEKAPVSIDSFGNVMTRGPVLTDEDSYWDDFVSETLDPSWNVVDGGGYYVISSSALVMSAGTDGEDYLNIYREGDYGPMTFSSNLKVDSRQDNNIVYVGFSNEYVQGSVNREAAMVVFDGVTLQNLKFMTMASLTQVQITDVQLPNNGNVTEWHHYTVEVGAGYCSLLIDDKQVARHKTHIPGPYATMNYGVLVTNRLTVQIESKISIENVMFRNHNAVEVSGHFTGDPLRVELSHIPSVGIVNPNKPDQYTHTEFEGVGYARLWTSDTEGVSTLGQILTVLRKIEQHLIVLTDEEIEDGDV